jgi:hypothetical protein
MSEDSYVAVNNLQTSLVALNQKRHHILNIPKSLGELIEQDYQQGIFIFFGKSKSSQRKGKEGVLWLLSTIYNRTVEKDRTVSGRVHLPARSMEDRFGKSKLVNWYNISKFCLTQQYILTDNNYYKGIKAKSYWLNPKNIHGTTAMYFHLKEPVIINKRIREFKRLKSEQLRYWKESNRIPSVAITRENLSKLVFEKRELNFVCQSMLNITADSLLDWINLVKQDKEGHHSDESLLVNLYCNTALWYSSTDKVSTTQGKKRDRTEESTPRRDALSHTHHSVPPFFDIGDIGSNIPLPTRSQSTLSAAKEKEEKSVDTSRRFQLLQSLISLLLNLEEKGVFLDNKGGRLYSPITNLKREARKALRYWNESGECERLVNFDIKTCQPWILGICILKAFEKEGKQPPQDVYNYLHLIENSDFYYAILDYMKKEQSPENREKTKKGVMKDFYRSKYYNKKSNVISDLPQQDAGKFVMTKFPSVWKWLLNNKGYEIKSEVPIMMQRMEADYFIGSVIQELSAKKIWCLTIHDSLLVRERDARDVELFLMQSILSFFGRSPIIDKEVYGQVNDHKKAA